ncbi:lipid A deacylase LpxR family protein [Cryomorpha ignava]|uniref:Lipid A deacylase LpxR family protein n=1 Tax=Cryomorpha ignava TaxID=101383 RepID=A0A7K3WWW8_9FLAO|nr:lipid A deacylase LpxR family protein [Cryomorpha ignava]NEN25551.1 lipid A deacylase LpxR family protein [Cryomorpha ignava]
MIRSILLILLIAGFWKSSSAQKIDHLSSYSDIQSSNYFRFNYDNDLFAGTDQNYTQGFSFELVAPFLDANPVNHLFYRPNDFEIRYGIFVEHIAYTPANFELPEIQIGDRPFAAAIYLKSFMIATDRENARRLTSSVSVGMIGPAAFGDAMQTTIHKITGSKMPLGWRNQVKNDLVLTYEMGFEQQVIRLKDLFSLQAQANVAIGTLFTGAAVGMNMTFGILNSPFKPATNNQGFKLYAYAASIVNVIGYDATLQGGLLNDNNPYTIAAKDVERVTGQFNYGIVLQIKKVYLEYSRTALTKEFATGNSAKWGGIKLGFGF